jgi:ribonuclease Z
LFLWNLVQKPFEVTVLGTSSATPTKDRSPSAQHVRLDKHYFLFDCGEGTQNRLLDCKLKLQKIKYVLITHLHGDHFFGLPGLITSMSLFKRTEDLYIVGPDPLKPILEALIEEGGGSLSYPIHFISSKVTEAKELIDHRDFSIVGIPLQHRIPCTGYVLREKGSLRKIHVEACEEMGVPVSYYESLKQGLDYVTDSGRVVENEMVTFPAPALRSFAYITDTVFDMNIVPYIQGVTLLYHESTFLKEHESRAQETFHSTAEQAGIIANQAKVKQLMLGHYSARYEDISPLLWEAQTQFNTTLLAVEGLRLELSGEPFVSAATVPQF